MLPRYVVASLLALGVDYGLYLLMLRHVGDLSPAIAAAPAYLAGAVIHYFVSRRFVFPQGWLHRNQLGEFVLFLLSGILGAALTSAVVWTVSTFPDAGIHWPKIVAVAVSFVVTYILRKNLVFRLSS